MDRQEDVIARLTKALEIYAHPTNWACERCAVQGPNHIRAHDRTLFTGDGNGPDVARAALSGETQGQDLDFRIPKSHIDPVYISPEQKAEAKKAFSPRSRETQPPNPAAPQGERMDTGWYWDCDRASQDKEPRK